MAEVVISLRSLKISRVAVSSMLENLLVREVFHIGSARWDIVKE
jgi:hypothetical protein